MPTAPRSTGSDAPSVEFVVTTPGCGYGARRRIMIVVGLAVVLGSGTFLTWRAVAPRAASAGAEPTYQRVALATFVESVPAPGTLQPVRRAELRVATAGTLGWAAEVGDRVEVGDVVAWLDPLQLERAEHDARLALERALRQLANVRQDQTDTERAQRSAVEQAERRVFDAEQAVRERSDTLAVVVRLVELGTETEASMRSARDALGDAERESEAAHRDLADAREVRAARVARSAQDVLDAQASLTQAEMTLQRAGEDLAAATLHAPFAGVVDSVDATAGSVVGANGLVVTLVDDSRLLLATQVDETEVGRLSVGLSSTVSVTAMPDLPVRAQVTGISPSARTVQNIPVFDVTLEVANPTLELRPGMTAEAEIVLREVDGTFSVPSRALTMRTNAALDVAGVDAGRLEAVLAGAEVPPGVGRDAARTGFADGAVPDPVAIASARAAFGDGAVGGQRTGPAGFPGDGVPARAPDANAGVGDPRFGTVRVRTADGSVSDLAVEIVASVGATVVVRGALPAGADIEVPPVVAATSAPTATGGTLPFGIGGGGGGRAPGEAFR